MLDSVHVDADGSAGGLITIWRSDFFKLVSSGCSSYFALISGVILRFWAMYWQGLRNFRDGIFILEELYWIGK